MLKPSCISPHHKLIPYSTERIVPNTPSSAMNHHLTIECRLPGSTMYYTRLFVFNGVIAAMKHGFKVACHMFLTLASICTTYIMLITQQNRTHRVQWYNTGSRSWYQQTCSYFPLWVPKHITFLRIRVEATDIQTDSTHPKPRAHHLASYRKSPIPRFYRGYSKPARRLLHQPSQQSNHVTLHPSIYKLSNQQSWFNCLLF